jgi:hypothetical protein
MIGEPPVGGGRGDPGPTLISDRLATIRDAVFMAAGDDPLRQAKLVEAVDRLARPLAILQDSAGDASDALSGSRPAIDRLTTALAILGGPAATGERLTSDAGTIEPRGWFGEPEVEGEPPRMLGHDQIGLIGLGAAYASIARPEAAGAIERGLAAALGRLMPLDLLWTLGRAGLDGDAPSIRLFDAVLDRFSEFLDPIGPDGWEPPLLDLFNVIPFDRREWAARFGCLMHAFDQMGHLQPLIIPYVIGSISPAFACPGQTVTITGSGFGSQAQTVRFPTVGGSADGLVDSWSDTQIEVVVPPDATCGDLQLVIPAGQVESCIGQAFDVVKPASGTPYFDGGIPLIKHFAGNGRAPNLRVDPRSTIEFTWNVCPSNAKVQLTVLTSGAGQVVAYHTGLAADGRLSMTVPPYTTPITLECQLGASGSCSRAPATAMLVVDVLPKPNVKIEGMEVTQGIQRFWRQGIAPNSVSTVASKDTIVRVYVSADMGGFNNDEVPGIIGVLSVGAYDLPPINGVTPTDPSGALPSHTARHVTAIDRNIVDHTLNFRIPASLCSGTKNLFCYLIVPGPGGTVDQILGSSLTWTWEPETVLKVRWVRITDNRPNVTPTTPTDVQALHTVRRALDLLPYPATDLAPAPIPTYTTHSDFDTDIGGSILRQIIANLRASAEGLSRSGDVPFDLEERWIGLTVQWFRGFGDPKTCIAPIYTDAMDRERREAAHELGHTLGLCHIDLTACFTAAGLTGEPTLDDVVFDPYWNQTIAATGYDFMSYTSPDDSWITTVNWDALRRVL